MSVMKAVRIHSFGGPEVLRLEEIERPEPKIDEILIRVEAASVNPVDWKMREGNYPAVQETDLPYVLGRDVCGTVEKVGDGVAVFRPGDGVYAFLNPMHGGYQQFVIARPEEIAPKPRLMDAVQAAAIPLAGITAWQGLFDHGGLQAGQRVLIHGGAGGVGHLAIQFAKAKGCWVATTVSSVDLDFARSLGADKVIDYKSERFEDAIQPVDVVFDLIAGETQDRSFGVVKTGGILVSTLTEPDKNRATEFGIRATRYTAQPNGPQLAEIGRLIEHGKVGVEIRRVYSLEQASAAQEAIRNEHNRGKIVLRVEH
ncbi:NADP-dependent oxidoreductase [Rhizobium leucaenae]|uniref:NADPH:quinone reductase-like Zn-dependent oxidoreductase n=1 Tax=Rhizobium leucaenae TaxID=29450 RepID=A0A7W6ZVA7_9HYPH|nr:NADP-dependent oxidoreductase [Rhizobium leucaenae]MBB4569426.1 NADPH:quinone reductase-like Zn-dependent oxidoreductase [Rhizobium leucaenae]MBB6303908.1 NADPH:quinone reductase-like Zn-dependent oxidoreductase [Rhizobium leucaenae]